MSNNFEECYRFSLGERERFDKSLLKGFFPLYDEVYKTQEGEDKQGVDYHVTRSDGSEVTIDAKTRKPGARKYWRHGEPELCIERYSIVEKKVKGWLFKDSPVHPDYIMYTFDRQDTEFFYVVPYQQLRKAAFKHGKQWAEKYGIKEQPNEGFGRQYHSDAVFVPASVVLQAIKEEMAGHI